SQLSEGGTRRASEHICVWRTGVRALASAVGGGRWSGDAQWHGIRRAVLCNVPANVRLAAGINL
ncbi:hypothetical protein Nmel_012574, partial [Mimus melanotis]